MTDTRQPSRLFGILSLPARLASRIRPNLAAAIQADADFYVGPRIRLFIALAIVAIAYPVVVSVVRALIDYEPNFNTDTDVALFPLFFRVYSESLPFMIAAFAVGILSPTLGALLVTVLLPIDIVAAAYAHTPGNGAQLIPLETAIPARLISSAMLWIGIVEIPVFVRRLIARWQVPRSPRIPRWFGAIALTVVMSTVVYLWANSLVWVIQPVQSWTVQGGPGSFIPLDMTFATFYFSWILVLGVAILTIVAGMLRGPEDRLATDDEPATSSRGLGRELLPVAALGVLLSGLIFRQSAVTEGSELLQGVLIVGGLLLAGPVLTRVLPNVPTPGWIGRIHPVVRWAVGLAIVMGGSFLAFVNTPVDVIPDYVLIALVFAIVIPVFRIVIDAGRLGAPAGRPAKPASPAIVAILPLLLVLAAWFVVPAVALANDAGEQGTPQGYPGAAGGLLGGAAAAAGAAAKRKSSGGGDPSDPKPINRPGPQLPPKPKGPPPPRPDGPLGPPKKAPPPDPDPPFSLWHPSTWF